MAREHYDSVISVTRESQQEKKGGTDTKAEQIGFSRSSFQAIRKGGVFPRPIGSEELRNWEGPK